MVQKLKKAILSNKRMRKYIIRSIKQQQRNAFKLSNFPEYDRFLLDDGSAITLHQGLRSFVNPDWQEIHKDDSNKSSFDANIPFLEKEFELFFFQFEGVMSAIGADINGKKMLEIGAGNTQLACMMAKKYRHSEVVASGLDSYYEDIKKNEAIVAAREKIKDHYQVEVEYINDNISHSIFEDESFDVLFSNTVLEHISELEKGFKEMHRILRPGGVCVHIYNPFFSYNGAHTVCSTDHPWGHCVMTEQEYDRFLKEKYPDHYQRSIQFFHHDLNKKSLCEFEKALSNSGFSEITLLKESNLNVLQLMISGTLEKTRKIYPSCTLEDLTTNSVILICKKT